MCSRFVAISRSDPRFSLLPTEPTQPTTATKPHQFLRLSTTTRLKSVKIKAAVNAKAIASLTPGEAMSFYDLLGISEKGTLVEIKPAYRQLARKYHPDVSPPDHVEEYTRRFIQVQEAYETLSDPGRRALYDRDMARGLHLPFSAIGRCHGDEQTEGRSEWMTRWQTQLTELKSRSMNRGYCGNMSWGERMRRQRSD